MTNPLNSNRIYRFGPYSAEAASRRLLQGEEPVPVTPKVFDLLLYLIEHRDRILPKEELLAAVWEGRRVEEANLTQTVSVLRKALGESEGNKFIGTFPGRGYRFLADVQEGPLAVQVSNVGRTRIVYWLIGIFSIAAILWGAFRLSDDPATNPTRRLITSMPGNEFHPALSADGRQLAFVWDGEQGQDAAIYIRNVDDDSAKPLHTSYLQQYSPAWSPDGRYVGYLRQGPDSADLVIVPSRGGEERVVTRLHRTRYGLMFHHLDWSPDGRWLVFDDKENEADAFALFLVDVHSGERRRLTSPTPAIIGDVAPRFSPDGSRIAFVRMTYRFQHDLYAVSAAGGEPRALTTDHRQIGGADWRRDGRAVLFSSDRAGGFTVFEAPLDGSPQHPTGVAGNHPLQLTAARHSDRLAYAEFVQDLNIWRLRLPKEGQPPRWERIVASTALDALPQVSPDGKWLSFRSDRDGQEQIWVSGVDGENPRALTRGGERPFAGRWSPDSRQLVFGPVGGGNAFLIPLSGGVPVRASDSRFQNSHPFFSADGHVLTISNGEIRSLDPATGRITVRAVPDWESPHGIRLGDKGAAVYYVAGRTGTSIWRGVLQTGATEKVMDGLRPGHWGSWSHCDGSIYYLGPNPGDSGRPWVMRRDLLKNMSAPVVPWPGALPPIGTSLWSSDPNTCSLYVERIDRTNTDVVLLESLP